MTPAESQKLVFYRSFVGSFDFHPSYLGWSSDQSGMKIQIPIEIQCGCYHPVNPESGMSVHLTKVDQGLKDLQIAFQPMVFFNLSDIFFKALDWLQAHMEHFSELVISSQDKQIQLSYLSAEFFLQITQARILKNQNNSLFWSPVRYEFKFPNRQATKDSYDNTLEAFRRNPLEIPSDFHQFSFKSPKTQNWITGIYSAQTSITLPAISTPITLTVSQE